MTGPLLGAVVVASNRAAAGVYEDATGPLLVEFLTRLGFETGAPAVVADGEPVGDAIRAAVEAGARVVLTTGGTGLTPTDRTPEVTRPLLDVEIPGLAGRIGSCLVVNLPGSRGGVTDALAVLEPVLLHAVEQVVGSDH